MSRQKSDSTRPISTTSDVLWDDPGMHGPAQELCFVIVFHPDLGRIGEVSSIALDETPLVLGRHSPFFRRECNREFPGDLSHADAAKTAASRDAAPSHSPGDSSSQSVTQGNKQGHGIADAYVSRQALRLLRRGSDWLLARDAGRSRLCINGEELRGELVLSHEQLQQGVLISLAQRVILHLRLQPQRLPLQDAPASLAALSGVSPAMQQLRESALLAAKSPDDVLLIGATGTGKERIAAAIHALSDRSAGPWVAVNMAALPVELASASLFGARKGAYTGADKTSEGFFRQANGGTLFLDEIGDTPTPLQPMLLRALQEREIQVVGGKTERVDLRVVAAMEQDPDQLREHFRPALRYRLGAQEIRLPSLQERREDVALLAANLFQEQAKAEGRQWQLNVGEKSIRLWARLFEQLLTYAWPGNIRELQHTIAQISGFSVHGLRVPRAVRLRLESGSGMRSAPPPRPTDAEVKEAPMQRIADVSDADFMQAWRDAHYEVSTVARELGVSRPAIYRRLRTLRECRLAADVPLGEMLSALDACRGDLASTADRLAVSRRGLQTRLRASGVSPASLADMLERQRPD
ncbi:MAG: sigma 54-interacting transcriptional regulator [Congregibacter sp.]|nr:sigma 54-interacting transcriptional regulator [Congregibacter sp.]